MTVPATAQTTKAVLAHLAGITVNATAVPVGDHTGDGLAAPFVVVYRLAGGSLDGPIDDTQADAVIPYQVTCVGRDAAEAEYVADQVRARMLEQPLTVTDRTVLNVELSAAATPITRDDDIDPPVFYTSDRFDIDTTP